MNRYNRLVCLVLLFSLIGVTHAQSQSASINCGGCCQGGVLDSLANFDHPCPPLTDAEIEIIFEPLDLVPTQFYLNITNAFSGTLVTDTFDVYDTLVTLPYCIYSDSCYTVSWWSPDSSNVIVLIELDYELIDSTGWGYHEDMIGYGCCEELQFMLTGTETSCPQCPDGSASVAMTNGKAPYSYSWTSTDDPLFLQTHTTTIADLSAGQYVVEVIDDAGCAGIDTLAIGVNQFCHIVTSTEDDGEGTFRRAFDCVAEGDTITFDPVVFGDTIDLTSSTIVINKSVNVIADPANGIVIDGSGLLSLFTIQPGNTITIQGLDFNVGRDIWANFADVFGTLILRSNDIYSFQVGTVIEIHVPGELIIEESVEIHKNN